MKKIIVPLDFSIQSENALKVAADLAKNHNAEILALHMLELNHNMISSSQNAHPEQTVFLIKLAEKRFSEFLSKEYLKGISITPIIKHYKVFSEINEVAKETDADLIVMGSNGSEGIEEVFVGSNTERVVRNADIPVLVIKNTFDNFKVDRLVFASNFNVEKLPAFKKAQKFASLLSAEMKLVYVNTPGDNFNSTEEIYKRINTFLATANSSHEVKIYNDYTVEKGILNYSSSIAADIIAIPTHGRTGLSHFFMGSIGEDVANHSPIPVVTFKI
ncbi:universal stress protein [Aurantibacter crassamenti]|uniref:universal stress protein n=1 Tax=Aurantibacter crassamenti TaxID=1837375 RepID=UPI00193929E5|nr:universal stress protein [Aurantibacter crassamenti]MBM1107355.1 universal stress protein [Aurantibacter crassamenti]